MEAGENSQTVNRTGPTYGVSLGLKGESLATRLDQLTVKDESLMTLDLLHQTTGWPSYVKGLYLIDCFTCKQPSGSR